jgi:RHS repeat-associated protein
MGRFLCPSSSLAGAVALTSALLALPALASSGVSDERVSLPDGPGSIGGIGENADVDPNMGLMSTSVPFDLPAGREGLTPSLKLSYSSGNGTSIAGIGWDFSTPSIERTSLRGVPTYDLDDEFVVDGGSELVRVDDNDRIYRARFEKSFVRYQWHDAGTGDEGYWTGEEPDGRVHYYGADETGSLVNDARVAGFGGTFRYHLVATVDPYGHAIRYLYTKDRGSALLAEVRYLYDDDNNYRFSVVLTYQDRPDLISDCIPGVNIILAKRLTGVVVLSHGGGAPVPITRLFIDYEDGAMSGGSSRIASVTRYGVGDEQHPAVFSFGYSASLTGGGCPECEGPYLVDLGTLPGGIVLQNGRATLLDINGDALPDMLSTPLSGGHQFIMSSLDSEGRPSFDSQVTASSASVGTGFVLDTPSVQTIDVNGDGFTDMVAGTTGQVLCNNGSGDWSGSDCLMNASLPTLEADDADEADPKFVRFFDYDNDKRIDMLRTAIGSTEVWHNSPAGFAAVSVDPIGSVFDQDPLHLADMNGDGLQDPTEILPGGQVRYRLNLGLGRWTDWTTVSLDGFAGIDPTFVELEDVNGDGLSDVVAITDLEVRFAINRNGDSFDAAQVLESSDVTGGLPLRVAQTTVLFADMNGNGARDIVWFQPTGAVQMVELFPLRPNLLTRIENGIGRVQVVEYETSVAQQARADRTWAYKLPHSMNVVARTDSWVTLTGGEDGAGLHEEVVYTYFDGYYDGGDNRFRGYTEVHLTTVAEDATGSQPASRSIRLYDAGITDRYFNGLMIENRLEQDVDGTWVPLRLESTEYADCDVDQIPSSGLSLPIRFICPVSEERTIQEGRPAAEWVTTRNDMSYDGYGNLILSENHGVVSMGDPASPSGCAASTLAAGEFGMPYGSTCVGDEWIEETTYVVPGNDTSGAWILRAPVSEKAYALSSGDISETRTYYDGEDFVGLPLGQLDKGTPTRSEILVETGRYLQRQRMALDAHGNTITELDALGDPGEPDAHRTEIDYDASGARVLAVRMRLTAPDGTPYGLERVATYDTEFLKLATLSNWRVIESGSATTPTETTRVSYDAFGRLGGIEHPSDDVGDPSRTFAYELGDPVSRILMGERSSPGGALDLMRARCLDGKGRVVQERTQTATGEVLVSGFIEFNRQGNPVRTFQPWTDTTLDCDTEAPTDVLFEQTLYDGAGRRVGAILPDADVYGDATQTRMEFFPLEVHSWDGEDADPDSPHTNTPDIKRIDGLGRTVEVVRALADGTEGVWTLAYDGTGNVARVTDPEGNDKLQVHDLSGRALEIRDPNANDLAFEWDDANNMIERTDGRGKSVAAAYDGLNRVIARWDPDDESGTRSELFYDRPEDCDDCAYPAGLLARVRYPLGEALDGDAVDTYHYDARGRTVRFTRALGGNTYEIETAWDHASRRRTVTYPDGTALQSEWDDANRLVSIDGVLDAMRYDARGDIDSVELAGGAVTTHGYDARRRISSLVTRLGGTTAQSFGYTYDRADNITEIDDDSEGDMLLSHAATFELDAWYRIESADFTGSEVVDYGWDLLSNVTDRSSSVATSAQHLGAFSYGGAGPSAVDAAGDLTYEYDNGGNMTKRGDQTLAWDYQGRLASVEGGARAAHYAYAAEDERVVRWDGDGLTIYITPDFEVRDGIATILVRHGRTRLARVSNPDFQTDVLDDASGDGEINAADAWLASGDRAKDELLFAAARRLVIPEKETTLLHDDHLGNITLATSDDGIIVGRRSYTLDGAERERHGWVGRYGFTGQEHEHSGLVRYQKRMLDPVIGRWTSVDPGFVTLDADAVTDKPIEATSAYGYVGGRSTTLVDEHGLQGDKKAKAKGPGLKAKIKGKLKKLKDKRAAKKAAKKAKKLKKLEKKWKKLGKDGKRKLTKSERFQMAVFRASDPRDGEKQMLKDNGIRVGNASGTDDPEFPDTDTTSTASDSDASSEPLRDLTFSEKLQINLFRASDPRPGERAAQKSQQASQSHSQTSDDKFRPRRNAISGDRFRDVARQVVSSIEDSDTN